MSKKCIVDFIFYILCICGIVVYNKIKTYYVDQTSVVSISELFKNIGSVNFDIIIDDGLHQYNANICLFENSFKFLNKQGYYIIEDVSYKDKSKFFK